MTQQFDFKFRQSILICNLETHWLDYYIATYFKLDPIFKINEDQCYCLIPTPNNKKSFFMSFSPSTKWSQGGPIISMYKINIQWYSHKMPSESCNASIVTEANSWHGRYQHGSSILQCAMKSILAHEVQAHSLTIPEEDKITILKTHQQTIKYATDLKERLERGDEIPVYELES